MKAPNFQMTFPFEIPGDPKYDLVRKLLEYTTNLEKKITLLLEDISCLREDNTCLLEDNTRLDKRVTALENEIHRLKGFNCKPDIKPNTKPLETLHETRHNAFDLSFLN
ncbi:hypothetical protein [Salinisphaera sp. G21_0]|uniref:hypothetical protein n=1 Tax=Salinisphaera sp. G21_0 TaxID=2821094 RepID=UPI001ADB3283|nr:hypothetical protein [Salinisphaera sp. G21_0]MBO9483959.1 hypothetical protein [Salinisphaera sp. G21_0]